METEGFAFTDAQHRILFETSLKPVNILAHV